MEHLPLITAGLVVLVAAAAAYVLTPLLQADMVRRVGRMDRDDDLDSSLVFLGVLLVIGIPVVAPFALGVVS